MRSGLRLAHGCRTGVVSTVQCLCSTHGECPARACDHVRNRCYAGNATERHTKPRTVTRAIVRSVRGVGINQIYRYTDTDIQISLHTAVYGGEQPAAIG